MKLTFPRASRITLFMTCDALTHPMTKGISWPVESMEWTPWMLFHRIVVSMLVMNHAMLRTIETFHATQNQVSNRPLELLLIPRVRHCRL